MGLVLSLPSNEVIAVTTLAALSLLGIKLWQQRNYEKLLPPGPKKIPIFGNLFQVSALRPYPQFRKWAQEYGPVYHLKFGSQDIVVLNTPEAADELFVNRSKIFSSRIAPHVAHDIMSEGQRMAFLPYNDEFKMVRKSLQPSIGPLPSRQLRPMQELESRVALYDLMNHGDKSITLHHTAGPSGEVPEHHWFSLIRRFTTSLVLTLMYGTRVHKIENTPRLHKLYRVLANMTSVAQPGNYLADGFPILRKLPDFLAPWRVQARGMHEWEIELLGGFLEDLKTEMKAGRQRVECYASKYLKARAEAGYEDAPGSGLTPDGQWMKDKFVAYTAGTIVEAGSDTTASTAHTFILMMLSYPHVLTKLREEIDRVVGPDRLPTFDDEPNLPYLVACIKETLRRRPAAILGVPHANDEDVWYNGYLIPKGSNVFGNIWAIHMDPKLFPNPTAFIPERWLSPDGKSTSWGDGFDGERDQWVFGWGRRLCPGSYIAEASFLILLSRIIWGLDFSAPKDPKTGRDILPDLADEETFSEGFISIPRIFGVEWHPRSEKHAQIIRSEFEDAQAHWSNLNLPGDER
ncbi:hypothetical protein EYR40_009866 [Pleurotus pulmonarius]|nr:hypothetical protein EYR38_002912 [Pleurotus pulmonarius]KAF4591263.1 hypothetical protein EYR40_009866 [Pleurotus pulmonarius]